MSVLKFPGKRRRAGDRNGPSVSYGQIHQLGRCNFCTGGSHTMVFEISSVGHGPRLMVRMCRACLKDVTKRAGWGLPRVASAETIFRLGFNAGAGAAQAHASQDYGIGCYPTTDEENAAWKEASESLAKEDQ